MRNKDVHGTTNLVEPCMELMANPTMSRRGFFSLTAAVGALAFVGSIMTPGRSIVSAYADEEDRIHFSVFVLASDELPVLCYDVTNLDNKLAVEGMQVTITSLNNNETLTVTTDSDGFAAARIKALSQQADDDTAARYSFYGSVSSAKDGYRQLHYPSIYISSGTTSTSDGLKSYVLEIPTHPLASASTQLQLLETSSSDSIYLRTAALDDNDVQYCDAECAVGPTNNVDHTFEVEVIAPADNQIDVSVVFVAPGGATTTWGEATLTATTDSPTSYSTTFTGAWLQTASIGGMLKVKFALHGETPLVMTSPVQFVKIKSAIDDATGSTTISPGKNSNSDTESCPIPDWIFSGGDTLNAEFPFLPVEIFSNDDGEFGMSVTLVEYTFLRKKNGQNDLEDGDKLKHAFGGYSVKKSWSEYQDDVKESWNNFTGAIENAESNKSLYGSTPFTSKLEASFTLKLLAYASWKEGDESDKNDHWLGNIALQPTFGINYTLTKQFVVGIPIYIEVVLSAELQAQLALGFTFEQGLKNLKWAYDFFGVPVSVMIYVNLEASFSVAFGICGIAGIGLRGGGLFMVAFEFSKTEGKAFPHISVNLKLSLSIFVQVLFFKKSWSVFPNLEVGLYDNWPDTEASAQSLMSQASMMAAQSADMSDATMVLSDELSFSADYNGTLVENSDSSSSDDAYTLSCTAINKTGRLRSNKLMSLMDAEANSDPAFENPYNEAGETVYNPLRGLKPTYVNTLFPDGYSDSHVKVVNGYDPYFNYTYTSYSKRPIVAARLVTVVITDDKNVNHTVTRVAYAVWDESTNAFGDESIVELFSTKDSHVYERYDVDFDFTIGTQENLCDTLFFAITSIIRPDGSSVEANAKKQFVSLVKWQIGNSSLGKSPQKIWEWHLKSLLDEGYYTSGPRLCLQNYLSDKFVLAPTQETYSPHVYYYKTNAETEKTTLNVTASLRSTSRFTIKDEVLLDEFPEGLTAENLRRGSLMASTPDGDTSALFHTSSTAVIAWKGRNSSLPTPENVGVEDQGAPYSFIRSVRFTFTDSASTPGIEVVGAVNLPNISSLNLYTLGDSTTPFTWYDETSTAKVKPRQVVQLDSSTLALTEEDTDDSSAINQNFQSPDGQWLYTVRVLKQEVPGLSDDAMAAIDEGAKVYGSVYKDDDSYGDLGDVTLEGGELKAYVLMEAAWLDKLGYYSDFYPIAQLDSCPDTIDVVQHANGRRDFLFSTISVIDKTDTSVRYDLDDDYDMSSVYHTSDICHVAVPQALGLHVKNLQVTTPFAAPGENVYLLLELANFGNWYITGFVVDFYGPDDSLITTTTFEDLQDRVQDTQDNYSAVLDADGNYTYDENGNMVSEKSVSKFDEVGILAPGTTRTYQIEFTIPETQAAGAKTDFSLQVRDPFCSTSTAREDYFSESDLTVDTSLVYVDPNIHGLPGSGYDSADHVWTFESVGAPYAKDGEDPQPPFDGDVDGNGKTNAADAQIVLDIANANKEMVASENYAALKEKADVNGDWSIDALDSRAILNAYVNSED